MHGRMKVRSTAEQQAAKKKERAQKASKYTAATSAIYAKRANGDHSDEALGLTQGVLSVNPEITTLWNYRREIFLGRQGSMSDDEFIGLCAKELGLLENCLRVNPKAYSVWFHRQWILEHHPKPDWDREKQLCDLFLKYDERNFHCWDYRRHVIAQSSCVTSEQELAYSYEKIASNFSNYSAWHYRSKLLPEIYPSASQPSGSVSQDIIDKEHELVANALFTDPDDQSAWFYHRWLLGQAPPAKADSVLKRELDICTQLLSEEPNNKWCLLSCVLIMKSLGGYLDEIHGNIAKLISVDPLRKNFYSDLLSGGTDKQSSSTKGIEKN